MSSALVSMGDFKVSESADSTKYIESLSGGVDSVLAVNSPSAYGTWSQDIYIDSSAPSLYSVIDFICDRKTGANLRVGNGYSIVIYRPASLTLRRNSVGAYSDLAIYATTFPTGWYNIKVTRDLSGQFKVYVDGVNVITVTDTTLTESMFYCWHPYSSRYRIKNIRHYTGVEV